MEKTVYLDNNATTMVAPEVFEAMKPFFVNLYGNPSSMHAFGGAVGAHIKKAREQVAALLGATPGEIVFTGGGSEGDNLAIRGAAEVLGERKNHLVTTRVEHPAVRTTCRLMQQNDGYRLTEVPVDKDGALDMEAFEKALTPDTAVVSVMWANNETGVVFPIERIAQMTRARGIVLHVDAVQAVGKIPIDMAKVPVDLLSLSGHKLHGPKGIGALYVRKGTKLLPQITGGHQEGGKRAGTENVPAIVGLGAACELANTYFDEEYGKVRTLRDRLQEGILAGCKDAYLNGHNRLPNTLNVSFEYVEGEAILLLLDELGIAASSGSACASGSLEPSHVMRAMGVPFTRAHGSIRYSLSRYNTEDEIDYVVKNMPAIIDRLREISPFVGQTAWQGSPLDHDHSH